jgi:hypothetical protein
MISLKNYRGERGNRGGREKKKKREKTTTPNHEMEGSSRKIKLCPGSHR